MSYTKNILNGNSDKKYALEHLDDSEYSKCYDELMAHMKKAYKELLDKWVKEDVITQNESDQAEAEYRVRILESNAFDAILGEA